MDRRNPHRDFDKALIEEFLRGREVVSAELLTSGKINTNYRLVLDDGETYALRLYSGGNAEREHYVMSLVKGLVPVPKEVYRGNGWSVFTFLEGEHLENTPENAGAAAEALARISSVEFKSRGWINAGGSISPFPFEETGRGFITEILENHDVLEWIGQRTADAITEIMERESQRRKEIDSQSRLVHGDFNPTNILIQDGKVSGILDWEFSHSGSPYMDIGNLLRNTDAAYHEQIRDGLLSGGMGLPDDWKQRAALIDVGSYLESLTSQRADAFKEECVAKIEDFISKFSQ